MIIENICVATDGSDVAIRAAQLAVVLAKTGARRIVALSVAKPQFSLTPGEGSGRELEDAMDRALKAARAHVNTVARIAKASGVACETLIKLASSPGSEIVRTAEEYGYDLIFMGSHGPSALDRGYAGSVALHVLACSHVPVLVLCDPRKAAPPEISDIALS